MATIADPHSCSHERLATIEQLDKCIQLLRETSIRLVVFDMDLTAVAAHSRGRLLREDLDEYVSKATPSFLALVPKLHENGFFVAIATHSDEAEFGGEVQPDTHILGNELATALVERRFPPTISKEIFIVAYNPRVHQDHDPELDKVKRYHMRKLVEKFKVKPSEIIFFDDTPEVVMDCKDNCGVVHSFQVDPSLGFQIQDLLSNLA